MALAPVWAVTGRGHAPAVARRPACQDAQPGRASWPVGRYAVAREPVCSAPGGCRASRPGHVLSERRDPRLPRFWAPPRSHEGARTGSNVSPLGENRLRAGSVNTPRGAGETRSPGRAQGWAGTARTAVTRQNYPGKGATPAGGESGGRRNGPGPGADAEPSSREA